MNNRIALYITAAAVAALASPAEAGVYKFDITGSGITGAVSLTYAVNPNTGVLPQTSPNPVDPIGSYIVTGINGTFSDSNIGLSDAAITGIVASEPGNPTSTNLFAPHSFGFYPVAGGVPGPGGTAPGFSYDNLFYPGGSPRASSDYPFHGGILDIYGIVFTLADGNAVNLWSNGDLGRGVTYGAGVTDGKTVLDYVSPMHLAGVPEPATWAMMIFGFGAVGAVARRKRGKVPPRTRMIQTGHGAL